MSAGERHRPTAKRKRRAAANSRLEYYLAVTMGPDGDHPGGSFEDADAQSRAKASG